MNYSIIYSLIPFAIFIAGLTIKYLLKCVLPEKTDVKYQNLRNIAFTFFYILCALSFSKYLFSLYNIYILRFFITNLIFSTIFMLIILKSSSEFIRDMIHFSGIIKGTFAIISTYLLMLLIYICIITRLGIPSPSTIDSTKEICQLNFTLNKLANTESSIKIDLSEFTDSDYLTIYLDKDSCDISELPKKLTADYYDFKIILNKENNNFLLVNKYTKTSNLHIYKDDTKNILEKVTLTYEFHIDKSHLTFNTN